MAASWNSSFAVLPIRQPIDAGSGNSVQYIYGYIQTLDRNRYEFIVTAFTFDPTVRFHTTLPTAAVGDDFCAKAVFGDIL